ncbi:unnamed protein product [Bursaphelenchus xylophilus]|uniref:(pine wood nematode) hypothetical protein n=1 Tax=Bursaphelenchus xylophilus TaxID=6326 RepID=A0A7I8XEY2_BURXY|nr:unnamed protein product [Bursaphelenchus xylophilus]CAG9079846.1 unnamed protein product [Bursaphelenchus xylophilus]
MTVFCEAVFLLLQKATGTDHSHQARSTSAIQSRPPTFRWLTLRKFNGVLQTLRSTLRSRLYAWWESWSHSACGTRITNRNRPTSQAYHRRLRAEKLEIIGKLKDRAWDKPAGDMAEVLKTMDEPLTGFVFKDTEG